MENYSLVFGLLILMGILGSALALLTFYISAMQTALLECAPTNQNMKPALVWLQLPPLLGVIWQFYVIRALRASFVNEWRSRGFAGHPAPGKRLGLVKAIVDSVALMLLVACLTVAFRQDPSHDIWSTPDYLRFYLFLASLVMILVSFALFVTYWVNVASTTKVLQLDRVCRQRTI
jgi:hypothetical protein